MKSQFKLIVALITCVGLTGCNSDTTYNCEVSKIQQSNETNDVSIPEGESNYTEFVMNEKAESIMKGKYLEIISENNCINILYCGKEISLDNSAFDVSEDNGVQYCFYGIEYIGTMTPVQYYIVNVTDANEEVIIQGVNGVTLVSEESRVQNVYADSVSYIPGTDCLTE